MRHRFFIRGFVRPDANSSICQPHSSFIKSRLQFNTHKARCRDCYGSKFADRISCFNFSCLVSLFSFLFFLISFSLLKRKRDFFWQKEIETRVWWTAHSPIPINWQRQPFGEIEPFSEWIVEPLIFKWVLASLQDILLFKSLLGRRKWHLLSGGITTSNTLREIIWRRSELSTLFMV